MNLEPYLIVIILGLLLIILIMLVNSYFHSKKKDLIKEEDQADILFESLRYLNEVELDKHFIQRGGDNTILNIKNTFSIENSSNIDIDKLPFKVKSEDSQTISAEKIVKKSPISKFLYLLNKLKNDEEIIVFDNNALKQRLRKFRKLQTDADEFDFIQIHEDQILEQRQQLQRESSPAKMIVGKLKDKMNSTFCFMESTTFLVTYLNEKKSLLYLDTQENANIVFKVSLLPKHMTEEGKIFFEQMNGQKTPLNIFGNVSYGEKEGVVTIIMIPTMIF